MASARALTTSELGLIRYERARAASRWPIVVQLRHAAPATEYVLHVAPHAPTPFRAARAPLPPLLSASLAVAPGPLTYTVTAAAAAGAGAVVVSTGGLTIRAPEPPLAATRHAAALTSAPPSGARQEVAPGRGSVRFAFAEELWFARAVDVVWEAPGGEERRAPLRRAGDVFEGVAEVAPGRLEYRFRVTPRERTRVDAAPLTRLGWDPTRSTPDALVTWPLEIEVADMAKRGATPGEGMAVYERRALREEGEEGEEEEVAVEEGEAARLVEPEEGERKEKAMWGVVVAVATIACALGAGVALMLVRGDDAGIGSIEPVGVDDMHLGDQGDGGKAVAEGVQSVLKHARSQPL